MADKNKEAQEAEMMENTSNTDEPEEESFNFTKFIYDWANNFMTALIFVVLVLTFVVRQVSVSGTSMTDTLKNGDRLIVYNFLYTPENGDIIVANHGSNYSQPIIKRVIATAGQTISIDYSTYEVSVDGVILDEKYIKGKTIKVTHPVDLPLVVPEGYVFVMGDNREGSLDSRSTDIGLIPLQNIIGKAEYRMYPFDCMGSVYN